VAAGSATSPRDYEQWRDAQTGGPSRSSGLEIHEDLDPAAWIEPQLVPDSFLVHMMVPRGFPACARIFFPFHSAAIAAGGVVAGQQLITWTELARRNGRTAHALMEAETILAAQRDPANVVLGHHPPMVRQRMRSAIGVMPRADEAMGQEVQDERQRASGVTLLISCAGRGGAGDRRTW